MHCPPTLVIPRWTAFLAAVVVWGSCAPARAEDVPNRVVLAEDVRNRVVLAEDVPNRVQRVGGVPTFIVDGKPHSGVCYSTYDCSEVNLARRAGQFAAAGCHLYNFVVEISGYGFSRPMWVAPDRWDFAELDRRVQTIIAVDSKAKLLPRIYIDAPDWWLRSHPEARMILGNGKTTFGEKLFALPRAGDYASLASPAWRADMRRALDTVVDHIERSGYGPRVVGYQLSGQKTEEWYHWSMNAPLLGDYSPAMQGAFRDWLAARYGTDAELQAAWSRGNVTRRTAEIPTQAERFGDRTKTFRDPSAERSTIDFHRFWSDVMADTIAYFARAVKAKTGGGKLVGAFYGYTLEFTDLAEDAGHLALGSLETRPEIDFVMAPSSYFDRKLPGKPFFRHPAASLSMHGKIAWNDFDQVSYKYYDKIKTEPALAQWEWQMGLTKTAEQFGWMNRRELGLAMAQGVQMAHFDIHGGYYEDPAIMEDVRRLVDLRGRALAETDRTSTAQILVVVDEDSEHFFSFRNPILVPLISGQTAEMGFVGPYDVVLLCDLDRLDTRRYKFAVVLNAVKVDPSQRRTLHRKLACDGRTVLWLYAPGYVTGRELSADAMRQLCGIGVVADPKTTRGGMARSVADVPLLACKQCAAARDTASAEAVAHPARSTASQPGLAGQPGLPGPPGLAMPLTGGDPFCVVDRDAEPLALRADDSGKVVAARKRLSGWTSIYSFAVPVPAAVLRRWAAEAGVHLYTDRADWLIFADRHRLTLAASDAGGECRVSLPEPRVVRDAVSAAPVAGRGSQFSVRLRPKEVRIFELQ